MPTKKINVSDITRDESTQMRVNGLDMTTVREYAEAMEGGAEFPPITVFFDGKKHWLSDGWHTTAAHEKAYALVRPLPLIVANIKKGGLREAQLYATGANSSHGLRRTNADKRKSVLTLLRDDEWVGWSDGRIAQRAQVSQPFVSKLRREIEGLVDETPGSTQKVLSAKPAKRIGKDGVARSTAKAGKSKERKKTRRHPCRVCGCTDAKACVGGCYWVEDDLCSQCVQPKVTDKRRVGANGESRETGPAPGMIADGKKEKMITEVLKDKPLYISFTFIPKLGDVSVSVHRGDAARASRLSVSPSDLPRMPEPIQKLIVEQLNGKGK